MQDVNSGTSRKLYNKTVTLIVAVLFFNIMNQVPLKTFRPEGNMYWTTNIPITITGQGDVLIGDRTFKTKEEKALSAIILRLNAAAMGWKQKYESETKDIS